MGLYHSNAYHFVLSTVPWLHDAKTTSRKGITYYKCYTDLVISCLFQFQKNSPIPHFAMTAESLVLFSIVWRASSSYSPAWVYFWLCHWGVSNPDQTTWPLWPSFFFFVLFSCTIKSLREELVVSLHLWGLSCSEGEGRTKAKALRKACQQRDINNQLGVLLKTRGFNCMICLSP